MKTYTFHIKGMHCAACPTLIKGELEDLQEVSSATVSLRYQRVEIVGDFSDKAPEYIARDLGEVLHPHGYTLALERHTHRVEWSEFILALPIAGAFIMLFILLQKLGIVNLVTSGNVTYGTAFIIGLIASVSTCMAVVGGLVLSISANFAREGEKIRPQMLFHVGRLVSFFLLGGLAGLLGSLFTLGATGTFVLSFIVALILLVLGINLLDVFPSLKRWQPTLPGVISRHIHGLKEINHTLTPFLVGSATFFLPCGFTQSMQIYTFTTGSFWTGAFTMSAFALGTLPVLALLSFSSLAIHKQAQSGVFFKSAGLVVIFFGAFNLINSLVAAGIIAPLFSF
ncbi:MAG: hypothetical protein A3C84_04255 [Candidatus Ryanbacteria bacterium RIFCSPHIGHO2_02_FULL_48_12]|uniref:HMA domain-containing protein n=1 Tax=Candidatus Ryanbacteria bacterium RIFCSPHIGHO2_01_FULL_48_27 TaxID=1802115 RepID=A0A1G2G5M6_9BACT|nr:MAG: hypothetical protein A2756_00700 [Candidatus Ryanbacteria bacterium RIFCSPHIGHO2_01_FULL_48_27]OGZ48576.1 MAG: hypothetical protein A3C84_04255 [Candidatus Ryanbacteria bacterium RIFCSPHIGHO2_02_FULL_48_12]